MQKIFTYNGQENKLMLDVPEILLVTEFKNLMESKRNICKEDKTGKLGLRAFREFTYIWLAIDWRSIYADYTELDRHEEALRDSGITEEEFADPVFRAACRKYQQLQESTRSIKLLRSAQSVVDKFAEYFNNVDPEERDVQTGKPIFKVKDIMQEIATLSKVNDELKALESQVKKEAKEQSLLRGGAVDGFLPKDF